MNGLIGKLRKGAYAGLAAGVLGFGVLGCPGDNPIEPNNPPRVELSASPISGISPLEITIQGSCTDLDGQNDIASYKVMSGTQVLTTENPTNMKHVLTENAAISSECSDRDGERDTAGPIPIQVLQPGFLQSAQVVNGVDVQYSAIFENISEATLEVRNQQKDSLLSTKTITNSPYEELFKGLPKEDNLFILKALNLKPDTVKAHITNFDPEADFSGLNLDLNEGDTLTVPLPTPTDKNPEDNPVQYLPPTSLDGKTQASIINENQLKIQGFGEETGPYKIELSYGNNDGGLVKDTLSGNLFDLAHLVGRIEDARTNIGQKALIKVYNASDSTFMDSTFTDIDGTFNFKLKQPVDSFLFQTRLETFIPDSNYVRTVKLPGRDTTGLIVRAYPYNEVLDNAGIGKTDFRRHLEEINNFFLKSQVDNIQILENDPLGRGSFTQKFMELVKNKILEPTDIGCYVLGRQTTPLYVQLDSLPKHYTIEGDSLIVPDSGWATVTRDTISHARRFSDYSFNIMIKDTTERVVTHEFGHGFIAPGGHATILSGEQTIMRISPLKVPGPADCEASYVIYEPTFKFEGRIPGFPIFDFVSYYNILGLNWLGEQ